jgi:Zn-dependent peptidase ImmA (M78 family)/transcriptional regulator with XRE-family HTH domain
MNALTKLDPRELGQRLKVARTSARLTQEQAARHLDLARTTVVAIERGERRVAPEELVRLCELYNVLPGRLLQPDTVHADLAVQFRRAMASDDTEALAVIPFLQELASRYVELERLLERPLEPAYPRIYRLHHGVLEEQAEDLAAEVRSLLGIGNSPIPDVLTLIETELRIRLFVVPLPSKISGVYACHPSVDACILINANHPKARKNWTGAHELGHFMIDRQCTEITEDEVPHHSREERFANLFAGAFLMPASTVRKRYREVCEKEGKFSARSLIYLADAFYVSPHAMSLRLEHLGLFAKGTYEMLKQRGLFKTLAQTALGEAETSKETPVFLPRYTMIALEAHEKELISEGELARMLRIGRIEARKLANSITLITDTIAEQESARV